MFEYILILLVLIFGAISFYFVYDRFFMTPEKKTSAIYVAALKDLLNGKEEAAFSKLRQVVTEDPNNIDAYMRLGQIKKSIEYFKKALSINDNFHLARYWLGTVYMHTSDFENARHYFEVLLRKSPDYQIVHYHLGSLAIQMADFEEAIKQFNILALEITDDPQIYFYLGLAYYRQGKYLKAVSFFNNVIELYPEHPKVQSYLEDCEYELKTLM